MEEIVVEKALEKVIERLCDTFFEYLQSQFRWQTGMKGDLDRMRENYLKIQAVFSVASQVQIIDQNSALDQWIQQLQNAIDETNGLLDVFDPRQPEQLARNEVTMVPYFCNIAYRTAKRFRVGFKRALKIDPNLKKLEEVVQKLDRISADFTPLLQLIESRKTEEREQRVELRKTRETGYLPTNDLIGRDEVKEEVMLWLRRPSNEKITTLYINICILSIVRDTSSGKTTLLQHVYADKMMSGEYDLKMWVCVSDNFDAKKVIANMLESLTRRMPSLNSLVVLQSNLESQVMGKKFLLVLDDLHEEQDESKLKNVLSCLREGDVGSKILVTTTKDSVAYMIANVIGKDKKIIKIKSVTS